MHRLPFPLAAALGALGLIATVPALAQTWSAAVPIGRTSEGRPAISMAADGRATVAFGYTGNAGTASGLVYAGDVVGAQPWSPAPLLLNADAYRPGVAQDLSGAAFLVAGAGQWDNYSSATVGCLRSVAGTWSCGTLAVSGAVAIAPAVQFYGHSTTQANTAAFLFPQKCSVVASSSPPAANEYQVLTATGECVRSMTYALNLDGTGVAVYGTKTGDIAYARRHLVAGVPAWTTRVKLVSGNTAAAGFAAATAGDGSSTIAWAIGKAGTKTIQVWTAAVAADGTLGPAAQLAANACDTGVATTVLETGDVVVAWGGTAGTHCEAAWASRAAGTSSFSAARLASSGARVKGIVAAHSAAGGVVLAWNDASRGASAAVGSLAGFAAPVVLGSPGSVNLAAGGGFVNAAWCATTCWASTLALP
jgi:hypothetical protein